MVRARLLEEVIDLAAVLLRPDAFISMPKNRTRDAPLLLPLLDVLVAPHLPLWTGWARRLSSTGTRLRTAHLSCQTDGRGSLHVRPDYFLLQ